ncbi:MAG: NADH-quinone oxidoreductase subunit NuoE [Planctomycetota bacterium]
MCTSCTTGRHARVDAIVHKHDARADRLVPILQELQDDFGYLPKDLMAYVAAALRLPPAKVYGVATFYAHFSLEPKGRHIVRLCDGTACHVKRSIPILDALRERLGLRPGATTTDDLRYTVETVSCLGACGLAPVVVIDDAVHGQMTPASTLAILDQIDAVDQDTADQPTADTAEVTA